MTLDVAAYEKLGAFYLGRPVDPATGEPGEGPLLYDSRDLVTHAVCLGMTGSGKTGLGIGLIEEAALDGVPVLAIDPKGDLGNLLLTFPELRAEDFAPWVDPDEARRAGLTIEQHAAAVAERWRRGLADWGQDGERIARLRAAADFAVYTPGSEAGLPVSVLSSFSAPSPEVAADADLLRERVSTTARSLLGLLGIDADPVTSREHILLSTLLEGAWRQGSDLDLGGLIQLVQQPPIDRVGVMPLESFYPASDRFALAMTLNNLLAAPGFSGWLTGEPLDVGRLLHTPEGRPRVAVFSIAHLGDAERMFFVSLLLSQVVGWMRGRPGTTSLRAMLYLDEVFGYLPPVADPPSKRPLLTLLKQARAYGLGVVLATQNPVDLDYKALSNIGTWFLGRLQTERDKARLLDGLEGAAAGSGGFDRATTDRLLSGLDKRVFLLHDVHQDAPELFRTRWAMSYLRGPLTRPEIARLTAARRRAAAPGGTDAAPTTAPAPAAAAETAARPAPGPESGAPSAGPSPAPSAGASARPVLPPEIDERFLPLRGRPDAGVVYRPYLAGFGRVRFTDRKREIDRVEQPSLLAAIGDDGEVDWYGAAEIELAAEDLERRPAGGEAGFAPLPAAAGDARAYPRWTKDLAEALYRGRRLELRAYPPLGLVSTPEEDERDFRIRLAEAAREERDRRTAELRERYAKRAATLAERRRRAEQRVEREREQADRRKQDLWISVGTTVVSAFLGRKLVSRSSLGRATTAARGVGRAVDEARDVARAAEDVAAIDVAAAELDAELEAEIAALDDRLDPATVALDSVAVEPRRGDVEVRGVVLAWVPYRHTADGLAEPAWS